ncbi:SDR family NAD(P)-dependent oxidoreductase [Hydrogenophaga sp. YM1]|uniref:type I polyketide synthase n=1 Tax=Hydrogenophaga sp. YM1 TaxID=2806262 RepID=UPI0019573896|nr:type I polyketide synthase [Hydrogenophaga sp. YM1]QRR36013.1 SDR family NAD(P)-dependent oxidoreductase [Hydrogenophaga sp. YM1]
MNDASPPAPAGEPALSPLKRAFLALEAAQSRVAALEAAAREPVAIIGLGCRVPGGGNDADSFWRLMRDGVDAIGPLPADRWDTEALYDPDPEAPGRIATRAGGFLGAIDGFDAGFFGIAPREAQGMDPQQRLLLEVSWEALEHAGQAPDRLEGTRTGVYMGMCSSDYAYLQLMSGDRSLLDAHFTSGIAHSIGSGRLSYLLGLQGPSLTLDTACSSSLVAVHLACQALRAGDCRMALAGGVNLILSPDLYIALSHARMLAPDGRCKTFDASADGFARGEGCGVVVLKRLSDAQADGDRVLAVIRGSAVNQDGPSSGLTAPNGPAQEAVIREALARAGLRPHEVGLIEAHGTGTQLGDPLEVQALGAVFGAGREQPLWLGSVKTNLGHLEAAAGVTGLIKLVLSLRQRQIPPHLHFKTPNPHIPWDDFALRVPTALTPWEPINGRRIAGVSSFGFSGTNAHVLVEEAPEAPAAVNSPAGRQWPFVLSAKNDAALAALAARCAEAFAGRPDEQLADLCFSAAVGRAAFALRAVVLARSVAELVEGLRALAEGREAPNLRTARVHRRDPARIAFLFTGQGAQYLGMGRALYEREPVFRRALDECAAGLQGAIERPLLELLFDPEAPAKRLDDTGFTQPALFAIEYSLAQLWISWGIRPDAVMGHSVGELVAACVAGVMPLDAALRLIARRGGLMQSLPAGGRMAAVSAPEAEVAEALAPRAARVAIAAVNGPRQTVIAGAAADVDALCEGFAARGHRCQVLPVSHAFHSPLVEPVLDAFEQAASSVPFAAPRLRLVSNLTGGWADPAEVTQPRYWRRHVREAVRFADGLRTLASVSPDVCIEVGPHPTLLPFVEATLGAGAPTLVPTLRKGRDDLDQLAESLGGLFLAGAPLDWRAVWSSSGCRPTDLPSTPFQRERQWFRARPVAPRSAGRDTAHPLLGTRLRGALREVVSFEQRLRAANLPYLADHRVNGRAILPATGFLEMALAASRQVWGEARALHDVAIVEPLAFEGEEARTVQVIVRRPEGEAASVEVLSQADGADEDAWQRHALGRYADAAERAEAPTPEPREAVRARCTDTRDGAAHREGLRERQLDFGPSLHGVRHLHRQDGEALGEIELPAAAGAGDYLLHPALLDACLQVMAAALPARTAAGQAYLPMAIERLQWHRTPGPRVTSHARIAVGEGGAGLLKASVSVSDDQGPVATLEGIALRPLGAGEAPVYAIEWPRAPDAAWLPAPTELAALAGPLLDGLAREHGLDDYQQAFLALESLSADWIVRALAELGWRPAAGERVEAAALARELGVAPRYHRLLPRLLAILAEDGVLRAEGGAWTVLHWPTPADPMQRLPALLQRHPAARPRFTLTANCGEALGGILRGAVDPLHRLFPDGSAALAEALYRDAPEAKAYNQLVRETVRAALRQLPPGQRLRVLEVGGGTGGTTAWLAPALPAGRCDYLFTDVGPSMVARAKEAFAAHRFMAFQALDLEQDLAAQGLDGRRFDLVIASNVVHATADLRRTLGRLRGALAPGGTLLMLEVAGDERWIDITFGLTEGWWRFTDTDLRPRQPLLSRERWLSLLAETGFEAAAIDAPDPRSREVLLAARKPVEALEPMPAGGRWLLLTDQQGVGDALAAGLRGAGQVVDLRPASAATGADAAALREALAAAEWRGVVHLGSLDTPPAQAGAVVPSLRAGLGSLLDLVQAMGATAFATAPRLWIATRGAMAVDGADAVDAAQAPTWGLGKVIALEHPEWRASCVDLDPRADVSAMAEGLLRALATADAEDQVALRGGQRHVARLAPFPLAAADDAPVRLEKAASGVFDDMALRPMARRAPGPGEVEIAVRAAGLNFRDIMNAVALRDDPEPLGGECAGRIVRVGEGVTRFAVGDAVVATGEACFASHVTTQERHVAPLPRGMGYAQAATLPFAFMTAWHALHTLGGLRPGLRVLIHAGAGGVGMAALQLARRAGAQVFATAGSEPKRATLRALGVDHVMDSRTLDFADEVLRLTQGRGVDLVLNSLAGDFIAASVRCLAADGVFLEIGKRDIWTPERFAQERPQARYHAIDLNAQRYQDPAAAQALFERVMGLVNAGELRPLPYHAFPLARGAEALRFMAQARHTGKVVLTRHDPAQACMESLSPEASYLVTGGLSGLGLISAMRLAEQGARHLVLVGRRAPGEAALATLDAMRALGVQLKLVQADMSRADEVARVLGLIGEDHPLRGVIHSAGVLEDGALQQQTWERFARPLGPKVEGAWALHALTRERPLDFFVLYSSVAGLLGSSGQGNHAAANAFLDALALHRRAQGLPGLSIAWGAWSEVGAAADRAVDQRVGARGIDAITPRMGLDLLQTLMRGEAASVGVFPVRWERFLDAGVPPLLERFRAATHGEAPRAASAPAPARGASLADELKGLPGAQRAERLLAFVGEHVARVVDVADARRIDPRQPLNELGLDSLMAVDLRNRLGKDLGLARGLPATLVFDYPTLDALAGYIGQLLAPQAETEAAAAPVPTASGAVEAIDDLSDEEIEALFAKKLQRKQSDV